NVSSLMSFGIQNNFEAKVLGKATDSTEAEVRIIKLVNNLSVSSAYDFAADSLNFSPVRVTGGIPIVEKLDLNFNLTLVPYALDNNNRRINTFNIDNGGSLFRLTAANISFNYSFSNKTFEGRGIREDASERLVNNNLRNGGRPDDLFGTSPDFGDGTFDDFEAEETNVNLDKERYNFKIPWNLRLAYTMTYSNAQRQNEITSHSVMFSGDFNISPRWQIGGSSGYDLKNNEFTFTQLRFQRDLESWNFSFNWVPFSPRTSWYFFIGIKANVFQDIKWDKRNEPDQTLR
ncbi:MAG: putative LPS assembly protein LptD, partial [Flavobacteriaceae bacterium]|nr:putative LPS assembly protein LptD [Flavobacteriaceae bacterium]